MSGHAGERAAWFLLALAGVALALAPAGALPLPLAGVALALVLAIAPGAWLARPIAVHASSPALAARSDGAFHAGVVWAAARAVPPEDPFFAGLALRYAWGLHAWAAAWVALAPRLGAYAPLEVTSALAAVSTLLAVGALARRLGATPRVQLGAQALALAGATPFAWLVLATRAASGAVRG